jgi:spore maturation protein CgeB
MKLTIFGLTISSSWGNGHATLWRGLCRALVKRGHQITFFERDVPYYAEHRDLAELSGVKLIFYTDWTEIRPQAQRQLADADVGMVTSYCPDGIAATSLLLASPANLKTFYDLDTPLTLECFRAGRPLSYIGPQGLGGFDLVFSYTGGVALKQLQSQLGARRVAPLYGSVDPEIHRPLPPVTGYGADISYLGTYAKDRQAALDMLFMEPARRLPQYRFIIGGALYPQEFPWSENISFVRHLPPPEHASFYCSSRMTLNITRKAMAGMGYCPSGRLFEAAACGAPIISDWWEGLDVFFSPGSEIIIARKSEDTCAALEMSPEQLGAIGRAARERALARHTAEQRAIELEAALAAAFRPSEKNQLMEA